MNSEDGKMHERRIDDERCVDGFLTEAGFPDDAELRTVLLQLRSFRTTEVPPPSIQMAALMAQSGTADSLNLGDSSRKHAKKRHVLLTSLAVAASLGVAGAAAAGNDTLRRQAEGTIGNLVRSFSPPEPASSSPAAPPETPGPGPAVVPPAGAYPTANIPTDPAGLPRVEPSAEERRANSDNASQHGPKPHPEVGTGAPSADPGTDKRPDDPSPSRPSVAASKSGQAPAGNSEDSGGRAKGAQR